MLKMEDLIREPRNVEEVKTHLRQGKLCMQKMTDATVLFYKDKKLIKILVAKTGGETESMVGVFDISMRNMEVKNMELPTLLNVNKKERDRILKTLVLYENELRDNE